MSVEHEYSIAEVETVAGAILKDGQPMTIEEILAELQANNRENLDGSDHVPDAGKMVSGEAEESLANIGNNIEALSALLTSKDWRSRTARDEALQMLSEMRALAVSVSCKGLLDSSDHFPGAKGDT